MTDEQPQEPAAPARPTTVPAWVLPVGTGVAGLVLGLVIGGVGAGLIGSAQQQATAVAAEATQSALFKDVVRECGANQSYALVEDDGRTLTLEHKGNDDSGGLDDAELWCIIAGLDAPAAVVAHMEQTTSMDGRQTESWDDIEVSWSYHPDRGMDAVVTLTE